MKALRTTGDLVFSLSGDGSLNVQSPGRPAQVITLDELITLSVSRGHAPMGATAAELGKRLGVIGEGPWVDSVKALVDRGLLEPVDHVPPAATAPLFAIEAGEHEGRLLATLFDGVKNVTALEPNDLAFAATDFFDLAAAEAQQFGVGRDWARGAALGLATDLLGAAALRLSKGRALQFLSPRRSSALGRLERLAGGTARFVVVVRHAFGFIDEAARALQLADPMVLYSSGLQPLLAEQPGDLHEALAHHYVDFARRVHQLQASCPGRVHLVRYEDLLERRAEAMRGVTQFIGEPDAAPVEAAVAPEGAPWPEDLRRRVAAIANEGLAFLGYPHA